MALGSKVTAAASSCQLAPRAALALPHGSRVCRIYCCIGCCIYLGRFGRYGRRFPGPGRRAAPVRRLAPLSIRTIRRRAPLSHRRLTPLSSRRIAPLPRRGSLCWLVVRRRAVAAWIAWLPRERARDAPGQCWGACSSSQAAPWPISSLLESGVAAVRRRTAAGFGPGGARWAGTAGPKRRDPD